MNILSCAYLNRRFNTTIKKLNRGQLLCPRFNLTLTAACKLINKVSDGVCQ